jgi:tRNA(Ile2) C34 agmatinyltransferase TiaS
LWGFLFYEVFINVNLQESVFRIKEMMGLIVESQDDKVTCDECGWSWKLSEGGDDPYTCHKCGHTNKVNDDELSEYSRTLKNARQQGVGLRFPKSAIKANPMRFRPYNRK